MSEVISTPSRSSVSAVYMSTPPSLDQVPEAPVYTLTLVSRPDEPSTSPIEGGQIRFTWDKTHLHVFFFLVDHDIVQEATEDQRHHYETGDVVELFLKPEGASWYWEFYVTPNGLKTAFFYPGRGYKNLPSALNYRSDLRVTAKIDGTLNQWRDRDSGWTALMSISLEELARQGTPLDRNSPWRVFVGRYNFGRSLPDRELSMFPALSKLDFHRHEEWARLKLEE